MRYSPHPATIVGSSSNPRPYTVYAKQDEARASEQVNELSVGELSVLLRSNMCGTCAAALDMARAAIVLYWRDIGSWRTRVCKCMG
jgi:hypothetical protein